MKNMSEVREGIEQLGFEKIYDILKAERAALHPDKTGGEIKNNENRDRYHFLDESLSTLDRERVSSHLIPISQLPAIIESVSRSLSLHVNSSVIIEKNLKDSFRADFGRKYLAPKIGSGVFAGISGFLFTQSSAFMDHPVLGSFFQSETGILFFGAICLYSSIFFIFFWMKERYEESKSSYLLSEAGLHDIYEIMKEFQVGGIVRLCDIRQELCGIGRAREMPNSFIFKSRLSHQIVDQILDLQMSRLEDRKVIERIDKPDLDKIYKLKA